MSFKRQPPLQFSTRLTNPPDGLFDKNQKRFLEASLRDIEKALENVYAESRKVVTSDGNPHREAISLDGKSGSVRVDLGKSQFSEGAHIMVYAEALGGNVSIAGFDNAYNWTTVHLLNRDGTNNIIVEQNAEISIEATTSLGKNGAMTLTQAANAPVWVRIGAYVSSA